MKADIILDNCTFVGVEGNDIEDIKNKIAHKEGLSDYGKSLLKVNIRDE